MHGWPEALVSDLPEENHTRASATLHVVMSSRSRDRQHQSVFEKLLRKGKFSCA
jgi:hypothetical protein